MTVFPSSSGSVNEFAVTVGFLTRTTRTI
jgi:hypothetical protein